MVGLLDILLFESFYGRGLWYDECRKCGRNNKLRRCLMVKDKKVENIKSKKYEVYFVTGEFVQEIGVLNMMKKKY